MNWENSERRAYFWFKENIDPEASYHGGADSTCGDIFSPLFGSFIEVKDITNGARCGQFTESTIKDNPHAQAIYDGNCSDEVCKLFVKYHYDKKSVNHFIIVDGGSIKFYTIDALFEDYLFEVQSPYAKRSGTRQAPKKDIPLLLKLDKTFSIGEDGKVYCSDDSRWGQYVSLEDAFDYFISLKNSGELRKRSTTKNMTWHLLIKKS